jgi:hypothetical protein
MNYLRESGTPEWIRTTDLLLRRHEPTKNQILTSVSSSCDALLEVTSLQGFRRHRNRATSEAAQGFYVGSGHSIGHNETGHLSGEKQNRRQRESEKQQDREASICRMLRR